MERIRSSLIEACYSRTPCCTIRESHLCQGLSKKLWAMDPAQRFPDGLKLTAYFTGPTTR